MYSKVSELTGLGLIALGIASGTTWWAGIIFGGVALMFIGGTTDDAAVGIALRRGWGWARYYWHRQILRERLGEEKTHPNRTSPQPSISVDPETEAWALRQARARQERAKLHDRTPALSRQDLDEDDQLERLA